MKEQQNAKKYRLIILPGLFLAISIFFTYCKDSNERSATIYDPSKPVELTSFYPDSGGVSTQMIIEGNNFGTDTSLIKVFVNGKRAPLINSNGSELYVLVPSRADTGYVTVRVGTETNLKEASSKHKFNYIFKPSVSTLCGFTDKDGKTAYVDGPINIAQFEEPYWLIFDNQKNIYLIEKNRGVRFIDKDLTKVSTLFRTGNGLGQPRTISFNPTFDTLYVANDAGNWTDIGTAVVTASSGFKQWNSLIYSKQCNGGDAHPQTGDYFYNSYEKGQVYKWHRDTQSSEYLFSINDVRWEFNIQFAPSGNFAYIVVYNKHYILRSNYNRVTRKLEAPTLFAGEPRGDDESIQYADGVGTSARFSKPHQGAFDENDNFYITDVLNHCIRKITPEGIVTTFAGRPNKHGYADGPLRESQFDRPHGIIRDPATGTFYVADLSNRRIRKISVE